MARPPYRAIFLFLAATHGLCTQKHACSGCLLRGCPDLLSAYWPQLSMQNLYSTMACSALTMGSQGTAGQAVLCAMGCPRDHDTLLSQTGIDVTIQGCEAAYDSTAA